MTCSLPELLSQACANNFDVAAEDKVMAKAVLLQMLCNFSGGATQQVFSGDGAPPASLVPAFGSGVYWDKTGKETWYYNDTTSSWE